MSRDKELYDLQQTIRRQKSELDQYKALVEKVKNLLEELIEN